MQQLPSDQTLPHFLIIGAQKCGTTSLFYYLSQHPDLVLPASKEIHFFDLNYHKGLPWYMGQFPRKNVLTCKHTGEASPYYLLHPLVPERVALHLPDVKLIVMLRNPVDRAYSHFMHEKKLGNEPLSSFEEAIELEPSRIADEERRLMNREIEISMAYQCHSYTSRGLYFEQITRWLRFFPLSQFHFIKSESFFKDAKKEMERVYPFLRLRNILPVNFEKCNANMYPMLESHVRKGLVEKFREDGIKLASLLGNDFSWELA